MKHLLIITICFLAFSSSITSQNFADPVVNPFGISPDGSRSSPALADIDLDNDFELFTGLASGDFAFYENIGADNFPSFGTITVGPFNINAIGGNATPFFVDLDDDGDLDLFSGSDGGFHYYENVGNATVAAYALEIQNPFSIAINPSGISKPYLVDIDDDGDMDLFSGSSDGNTYYYENVGTVSVPDFASPVTNGFGLANVGERSAPSLADLDGDSDFDMLIGNRDGEFLFFENTGSAQNASFSFVGINPFDLQGVNDDAKPTFGDLDGDGDMDLMVGSANGDYHFFENVTPPVGITYFSFPDFRAYPNPMHEFIIIESQEIIKSIILFDLSGKILKSKYALFSKKYFIDEFEQLSPGSYILSVQTENGKSQQKVVKF